MAPVRQCQPGDGSALVAVLTSAMTAPLPRRALTRLPVAPAACPRRRTATVRSTVYCNDYSVQAERFD